MASTIILSDNGASSGSAGLKSTAGNDGVLILQTTTSGGTATNAVYVDNLQNIGVGTTPSTWTSVAGKSLQINNPSNSLWANGVGGMTTSVNAYYNSGWFYQSTGGSAARFDVGNANGTFTWALASGSGKTAGDALTWTTVLTLNTSGVLALQGASTSATGVGITFPATQSASTDANTLDDYEEGSWTPQLKFGGNNTGMVNSVQYASYTKIGRVVHIQFRFSYSTKGSSTGDAQVTGLPFPATGNTANVGYSAGTFTFESNGGTTILAGLFGLAWEDSSIYLRANSGTTSSFVQLSSSNFGTTSELWGSIVYRTA